MNKKISKEAKRLEKRLKAIRNNHIDTNKEKEGILCVTPYLDTFHAVYESALFKNYLHIFYNLVAYIYKHK